MAITYTWKCDDVKVKPSFNSKTDVIYSVNALLLATDSDTYTNINAKAVPYRKSSPTSVELDTSDLSSFKAFASVTESDVEGWVTATLGSSTVTAMKTALSDEITAAKNANSENRTIG